MSVDVLSVIADDLGIVPLPTRMSDRVGRERCILAFGSKSRRRALTMDMAEHTA